VGCPLKVFIGACPPTFPKPGHHSVFFLAASYSLSLDPSYNIVVFSGLLPVFSLSSLKEQQLAYEIIILSVYVTPLSTSE
jgi:hypothetical protein